MQVTEALAVVTEHVTKHTDNKYQHSIIDTERPLQVPEFTLLNANKYIARYLAKSGEKTKNVDDLKKAVHFILFEIQTQLNNSK